MTSHSQPMNETPTSPSVDGEADDMLLYVALSFADHPRPRPTLQAPADTMDELREALRVLAKAYRAALSRSEAPVDSELGPDQVAYCRELADERRASWKAHALRAAPSPDTRVREALERIKDFPHDGSASAQGMSAIAREALALPQPGAVEPKLSGLDEEMILMGFHNAPSPALDPATVEACAKVCDRWIASKNLHEHLAATDIAAEIRTLTGKDGA